ncbi:MAG TPA: ABC transporter ATP-binding protein [Planctomycetes bacterium]|nr:ABC transporter ATP-binding protein [Planctomycetota bacterium]
MTTEYALEAEGLGKAYRMYPGPLQRVLEGITFGRHKGYSEFWALKDTNFRLKPGSSFGLCGANGAGKSTLLKILSGTTAPSVGRYRARGRVASLLELGAGFHMEFTGRANIVMNGTMMGLTREEISRKMDSIIDFAELGDYIDEPVRTYSSGMGLRLGFAVAVAVDPEILIIDEVFAVGDMYFQKKCVDKIYEFKKRGKTILFCSHSLYDVRQLCDQAIWLDHGECRAIGDSVEVTNEYSAFQRHHISEDDSVVGHIEEAPELATRAGEDLPHIVDARIYRMGTDEECYQVTTGDSIEVRVWWENPHPEETPIQIGVAFMRQDMTTCGGVGTHLSGYEFSGERGCLVVRLPNLQLLSGQFLIPVVLFDGEGVHKYQEYVLPENLVVRTKTRDIGLFRLTHEWTEYELAPPESGGQEA